MLAYQRSAQLDTVTIQEERNIVVTYNHPSNYVASPADLSADIWLDAEFMLIVNPDGTVHRYKKIDGEMVELEPVHHPDFVAPVKPLESE